MHERVAGTHTTNPQFAACHTTPLSRTQSRFQPPRLPACPPTAPDAGLSAYWSGVSPTAPAMAQYDPVLYFPKPTPGLSEIEPR